MLPKSLHHFLAATACLAVAACVSTVSAKDTSVIVSGADGSTTSYKVDNNSVITFDGNVMTVTHASGSDTHNLADVAKISFDGEFNSAQDITADMGNLVFVVSHRVITVKSNCEASLTLNAYTTAGTLAASVSDKAEVSIDFAQLEKGIYIVTCGGKTIKFANL